MFADLPGAARCGRRSVVKKPANLSVRRLRCMRSPGGSAAQVGRTDIRIFQQVFAGVVQPDTAGFQYVAAIRQA